MNRENLTRPLIALLALLALCFILLQFSRGTLDALAFAQAIVASCEDSQRRATCYEEEIPRLMDEGYSMEEAFSVTREVLRLDPTYKYCHVVGHKLTAKETAKDPSKWKEVAVRSPIDLCSYGGIHGAFQERFRAESMPDASVEELGELFRGVCDKGRGSFLTENERTNCMHAVGHLIMYVTDADAHKAVAVCGIVGQTPQGEDWRRSCFDGAFMQLYQPLEPEDFALIEGKAPTDRATRDRFCDEFQGIHRVTCIKESWPLVREDTLNPEGFAAFCESVSDLWEDQDYCMGAAAYMIAARNEFDETKFTEFCAGMPERWAGRCLSYGAPRFMEIYWEDFSRSLSICERAAELGAGDICYERLAMYSTITFAPRSKEAEALCAALPLKYRDGCTRRQQETHI